MEHASKTTESLLLRVISLSSSFVLGGPVTPFQDYFLIKERTLTLMVLIYRFEESSFAGIKISNHHNFLRS